LEGKDLKPNRGKAPYTSHLAIASMTIILFAIEYILVYISEALGILLALASSLIIYALISIINISDMLADALENITILLIYIMLMSGLPWFYLSQSLLVPGVYTIVLALGFWKASAKNPNITIRELLESLGIKRENLKRNLLVGVAGIPLGATEYYILKPPPPTPNFSMGYFLQTTIYMLIFVAFGEELLFRALIQKSLQKITGEVSSVFWSALIFAAMHTVWRSIPELLFVFAAGLILGGFYLKTGNLTGPIMIHAVNNIVLLAIMPYVA